jgi:deoxyribodipyrimidine photo-lyase
VNSNLAYEKHHDMNHKRVRILKDGSVKDGPIALWMSRDQRVHDNWALLFAQDLALKQGVPLCVIFCLVPDFLGATTRQYRFMLKGLREVEGTLTKKNIPFFLLTGPPCDEIPKFIRKYRISALVKDFDPLSVKRKWSDAVVMKTDIPVYEVDAHNIVPCWIASSKREFGAYTLRPKIHRILPEFLDTFPQLKKHPIPWRDTITQPDWEGSMQTLSVELIPEVSWIKPGENAASGLLKVFIKKKLLLYVMQRNDPAAAGQSNLSPYLHFGHISAQRIALEVSESHISKNIRESYLEELIIRRELADNFCFYTDDYDKFEAFPEWAKKTLSEHREDRRKYLYTSDEFERALTHDDLWNAAQLEMMKRGKMHGYLRMYWAKKILEWTESPEQAMEVAIYLNDKYELDGRDPNGYTGIAWSIGGVHDRAWGERPIFGKIRYMSYQGCKSKFNVKHYIASVQKLSKDG